jgi:hypothetical protein
MIFLSCSCSKLVEVDPPITSTNGGNIFNEDAGAISVLTSIYSNMSNDAVTDANSRLTNIFFTTGLTGDEFELWDTSNINYGQWYYNNITPLQNSWSKMYNMIYIANSAIENLPNGKLLNIIVKNQLIGEAKFIRALTYFYLVNLYGDVPLILGTDYKVNRSIPRTSVNDVYSQIISDLKDAQQLLNGNYIGKDCFTLSTERVRPIKWAATALLSRVYLYKKNYTEAEINSTSVINHTTLYELVDLKSAFTMNNKEAIWQLQSLGTTSNNTANTKEGQLLKLFQNIGFNGQYPVYLTNELVNSFDAKDQRKNQWINNIIIGGTTYYFAYKYKLGYENQETKEYSVVLRLAEQYLIRAEARIQLNKTPEGIGDLNEIRLRATDLTLLPINRFRQLSSNMSKSDALKAVEDERRHELFSEWGHRWLDLKRTNRADAVLSIIKGDNWQTTDQLFPIPQGDITGNPSLHGKQNPGY